MIQSSEAFNKFKMALNVYTLQKINKLIKNKRIRNFGIWMMHITNRRYLAIFFDPVLACNLRCRSCYFSDEETRKTLKGRFAKEDLGRIAEVIFPRTMKLQIGCSAEPTLYPHNPEIIRRAKEHGVPYISLTTNANLLTEQMVEDMLHEGLNEFTISVHGVKKVTYEYLMHQANYETFHASLKIIAEKKMLYPDFKVRMNYTINNLNVEELADFFDVYGAYNIDILQLRALKDIGGEIKHVEKDAAFQTALNKSLGRLRQECLQRNIYLIEPDNFEDEENKSIDHHSYYYVSPQMFVDKEMDWKKESFNEFTKRTKFSKVLFQSIFK